MKRVIRYSSFILALGIMFSACYYMSYRSALGKLRRMESRQDMDALFDEQMKLAERMFRNLTGKMEEEKSQGEDIPVQAQATPTPDPMGEEADAVAAGQIAPERVSATTRIIAETFDTVTGKFSTREIMPDSAMIGMTRDELTDYLAQELVNMPDSERDQGLILNELITFSKDRIIVRKTYDSNRIDFLYYVAVKNGEVVVYHNDRNTVYEFTGISALLLSEEERLALLEGIRIRTQEELFSLLESYSS